jgi:hypothetical protein
MHPGSNSNFRGLSIAGVVFGLLGAYASFILKYIFQNVKKIETKNSYAHLRVLHAHKVVS